MTSPLEVTNPLTPSSSMPVKEYVPVKKIPRPMNCFMTYRLEKQQQIVNQCPGANHRDISKIIAKWWRELSDEEKDPYRIKAAEAKAKHLERYNSKLLTYSNLNKFQIDTLNISIVPQRRSLKLDLIKSVLKTNFRLEILITNINFFHYIITGKFLTLHHVKD